MIKSAGNRISPQEIEEAALATGLVAEAVALGVPTSGLAMRSTWWCAAPMLRMRQRKNCRGSYAGSAQFHAAQVIHWRDAMPINPNGKIDRTGLIRSLPHEAARPDPCRI
jgi:acyl-CoA synthetase (AMP-forming)/AMP-acid ligase II